MAPLAIPELKVFYIYAREDQKYREQLEAHMANLKRLYNLTTWFDRKILPGERWEEVIESNLNGADLIFLLVSPAFMDSDYCYNKEMASALKRHKQGEATVIPIIVRSVHWSDAPFSSIQPLPNEAIPIARWTDPDEAFYNVVLGVERVIKSLLASRQAQEWLDKGDTLRNLKQYKEAIDAYDQSILVNPNFADAYYGKGYALNNLKHHNEAIQAFDYAIRLDPHFARAYNNKGNALYALKRYDEAILAFDHAIRLDPHFARAFYHKGVTLEKLGRHTEAQQAYTRVQELGYSG